MTARSIGDGGSFLAGRYAHSFDALCRDTQGLSSLALYVVYTGEVCVRAWTRYGQHVCILMHVAERFCNGGPSPWLI
jgi:hypothetical protein